MTAWSDHITAPFQREFGHLWVVSDPDEILLAPTVAAILAQKGFELVTYRDPLAFRYRYEAELRLVRGDGAYIVHVRGDAGTIVPWDVLTEARLHALSIPELFGALDANAVRAVGAERYDDLWQVTSSRPSMPMMGTVATKDFLAANLYRVVPDLLRRPTDLWEQAFDLFFRGSPLPHLIARHVAERACRPQDISVEMAASILSDRATFIDRVQLDWDQFARASARGEEPPARWPCSGSTCCDRTSLGRRHARRVAAVRRTPRRDRRCRTEPGRRRPGAGSDGRDRAGHRRRAVRLAGERLRRAELQ